jgi:hypothetical protein
MSAAMSRLEHRVFEVWRLMVTEFDDWLEGITACAAYKD